MLYFLLDNLRMKKVTKITNNFAQKVRLQF